MNFTFTGLSYLLLFFSLSFLSVRFYQNWRRENTTVAKTFFFYAITFLMSVIITVIGSFFFTNNTEVLRTVVILASFFQGLMSSFLGYVIFYLKIPRISPWFGFAAVFVLCLVSTFYTANSSFYPVLEANGAINWDIQTGPNIFRAIVLLITIIPISVIFFQEGIKTQDKTSRDKSFGLALLFLVGLFAGVLEFLLEQYLNLGTISSDFAILFLGIYLFFLVIFTQKPSSQKAYGQ